jgi:hypothetical protein
MLGLQATTLPLLLLHTHHHQFLHSSKGHTPPAPMLARKLKGEHPGAFLVDA